MNRWSHSQTQLHKKLDYNRRTESIASSIAHTWVIGRCGRLAWAKSTFADSDGFIRYTCRSDTYMDRPSGMLRTGYRPIIKTCTWMEVNGDNWKFMEVWPVATKLTQLRERASTELAKFHRSSIVRSSLYRYAHRLSSRLKLFCCQNWPFLKVAASGAWVYCLFGSTGISKRLLETTVSQR